MRKAIAGDITLATPVGIPLFGVAVVSAGGTIEVTAHSTVYLKTFRVVFPEPRITPPLHTRRSYFRAKGKPNGH